MNLTPEQLDEIIHRVKHHGVSALTKKGSGEDQRDFNLISKLHRIPKANIPSANFSLIRSKILNRISLSASAFEIPATASAGWFGTFPRFFKITGGLVGGFMILLSLTIGTAVTALESVPGQTIYPIKQIVENVQLKLASSEEQKTNLQIKFANERVDEMESILQKQKEGKASEQEVQRVVANTVKDLQKTSQAVSDQSDSDTKVSLLTKIVNLNDKQSAVIEAAQIQSEGEVKVELTKAWEVSKTTKEEAIKNIENAGLLVEKTSLIVEEEILNDPNAVYAEGKLTTVTTGFVNIGTAQFLLTKTTKYVNITLDDLKVGATVEIKGEVKDKKSFALEIKLHTKPDSGGATPTAKPTSPTNTQPPQTPNLKSETPTDPVEKPAMPSGTAE